jgi:hypothetical protein
MLLPAPPPALVVVEEKKANPRRLLVGAKAWNPIQYHIILDSIDWIEKMHSTPNNNKTNYCESRTKQQGGKPNPKVCVCVCVRSIHSFVAYLAAVTGQNEETRHGNATNDDHCCICPTTGKNGQSVGSVSQSGVLLWQ